MRVRECGLRETRRSWGMATDLQDPRKLRPAGLEPATDGLENRCSIRLSYGRIARRERHVDWRAGHPGPMRLRLRPAGLEPATCGLGNRRSIRLSYERQTKVL